METWGRDEWAHYLECGDGFWIIYVGLNLAQYALQICVIYCLSLHLNKTVCCCCFLKEGSEGEGMGTCSRWRLQRSGEEDTRGSKKREVSA